jgi:hypothetical protein
MEELGEFIPEELQETPEERFFKAVADNSVARASQILAEHPGLDLLWRNPMGWTPLRYACFKDFVEITAWLLKQPGIEADLTSNVSSSVFMMACNVPNSRCAMLLIDDPRTDLNKIALTGSCALRNAIIHDNIGVIKYWIASGREMILKIPQSTFDALKLAKEMKKVSILVLLWKYDNDPERIRHQVRSELGWKGERAADVFAQVVFNSDGLLRMKSNPQQRFSAEQERAQRFFRIMIGLPLELQMLVSNMVAGSARTNIQSKFTERGFRNLAREVWTE